MQSLPGVICVRPDNTGAEPVLAKPASDLHEGVAVRSTLPHFARMDQPIRVAQAGAHSTPGKSAVSFLKASAYTAGMKIIINAVGRRTPEFMEATLSFRTERITTFYGLADGA